MSAAGDTDDSMEIDDPVSSIIIERSVEERDESLSHSTGPVEVDMVDTSETQIEPTENPDTREEDTPKPEKSNKTVKSKRKSAASARRSVSTSNEELDPSQIVISSSNSSHNSAASSVDEDATHSKPEEKSESKPKPRMKKKARRKNETVKEFIDLVKPKRNRCLNTNCAEKCGEHFVAPDFCFSYFRVKKSKRKNQNEEICKACYNQSIVPYDNLATTLKNGEVIYNVDIPIINETLRIDDSDDEDEPKEDQEYLDDSNIIFFDDNIDSVLKEVADQLNIRSQIENNDNFLKERSHKHEESFEKVRKEVDRIKASFDQIQIDVYNTFAPNYQKLKGIVILDDYSKSHAVQIFPESNLPASPNVKKINSGSLKHNSPTVGNGGSKNMAKPTNTVPVQSVAVPKDLPVSLAIDKPPLKIDNLYYIARDNNVNQGSWIKARLLELFQANTKYKDEVLKVPHYRLVELKQQKERFISGKLLAYMHSCKSRLVVGTRVIAKFKELNNSPENKPRSDPYYAGVVAEHPWKSNRYRYLIFFDIGYAQYVPHDGVNVVLASSKEVWDDILEDSRPFIKKYLESQDRPMVKLNLGQTVKVEYNGKWWTCITKDIDCSLVQVYFDVINRWEWIYRGSTRLSPMYREEMAATTRHIGIRTPRKLAPSESGVVQYTRNEDFVQPAAKENSPPEPTTRSVARKSTTRPNTVNQPMPKSVPFLPSVSPDSTTNVTGPTSKIMYFTPRDQQAIQREYVPHECGVQCKDYLTHNFSKLRGHNPLSKPLLCGWSRMTSKDRSRKEIVYKAPCSRMIRNISEVHYYLRVTESEMTVDLFDFNHMVRCLAEFNVECTPDPKDLSNGIEHVPIPVINGFNNEVIDFVNYSNKRTPLGGVHMNLSEEFLCGCDCEDDCVDKLKCACWKMTLDGLKFLGKDIDPISVGYIYRRLQDQVITGIYECNARCKCNSTCLNRVAQHPMSLKLQVFKTHNRGWGIRCLNDIPQGTFICCYAGTLHTETAANEDGMAYGDEYFAELDYIEIVEKFKEDYEEEAIEDVDFVKDKTPPPPEEPPRMHKGSSSKKRNTYMDDNDFMPSKLVSNPADDSIRSRLRKRKDDEDRRTHEDKIEKTQEAAIKIKQEAMERHAKVSSTTSTVENLAEDIDTVTISDDEDECREVLSFNPKTKEVEDTTSRYPSVRELFGPDEKDNIYIMDAKNAGNIGRFLNHSCSPNVFVQNVFVDTHDVRFPWVAFFSSQFIRAGTELTWNYNYDIGSVPGRVLYCHCSSLECKGRLL